ncbi:MAG: hypothetical protein KGJ88_04020 [Verrucomicrobiota bacterium]|nr:hypothetical protein [Verrucomicrobiota bacterium]
MKKLILCVLCASAVNFCHAALPLYKTVSATGNHTAGAAAWLPADPNSQVRVVSVFYSSDTNNGQLQFSTATTEFVITDTNTAASAVTNSINSTNGLAPNAVLVVQHGGVDYAAAISSFASGTNGLNPQDGTNVVLASGGFGVLVAPGDAVYLMSSPAVTWTVGAATNSMNGDDIFSGNYGRPVEVALTTPEYTNQLNSVSAHYDNQAQP